MEVSSNCIPVIIEFLDLQYFEGLLQISFRMYQKVYKDFTCEREYKSVYDETMLNKINTILMNVGIFLEEEINLSRALTTFQGEVHKTIPTKCAEFLSKNSVFLYEFAALIIETCLSLNYSNRVSNLFSEILLVFVVLNGNVGLFSFPSFHDFHPSDLLQCFSLLLVLSLNFELELSFLRCFLVFSIFFGFHFISFWVSFALFFLN